MGANDNIAVQWRNVTADLLQPPPLRSEVIPLTSAFEIAAGEALHQPYAAIDSVQSPIVHPMVSVDFCIGVDFSNYPERTIFITDLLL